MSDFMIGDSVFVTEPDDFLSHVKAKVKGSRVGHVKSIRGDGRLVVTFPRQGRRLEYQGVFAPEWLTKAWRP